MHAGKVFDVAGIGFGPSNLALAVALTEQDSPLRTVFLERQREFGWHRGMLLPGTTMQVSFLKDLVTMRNPASGFSFLSYLHSRGRLATFINKKDPFPSRAEFHDYLAWAAARLDDRVRYGHEVVAVRPVREDGDIHFVDVVSRTPGGEEVTTRTRNLVLATGLEPLVPPDAPDSPRVWHSHELLHRLRETEPGRGETFVVVGAGQSAAEVVAHLHGRDDTAKVHAVFARYGYSPADDSPFVNGIFDPGAVDEFYTAPPEVKEMLLGYHANTNYSAVDPELIEELHRRAYEELVSGRPRLLLHNVARVTGARADEDGLDVDVTHLTDGTVTTLRADRLVYATGYRPREPAAALGELASYCKTDRGQLQVDRDHRVVTSERLRCGIYVQGGTEASHGLSSTLLSTTATRAGEIAGAIAATTA